MMRGKPNKKGRSFGRSSESRNKSGRPESKKAQRLHGGSARHHQHDSTSPHLQKQKKKHMDMIAQSLLGLHESYFQPSSNKLTSLTCLMRDIGAFHLPCSTLQPVNLLRLAGVSQETLGKICTEFEASRSQAHTPDVPNSPASMSDYLGNLSYSSFYSLFPAIYDVVTTSYHQTLFDPPPKRGSAARLSASQAPPIAPPSEKEEPIQHKVHMLIHDFLLPLSRRRSRNSRRDNALVS